MTLLQEASLDDRFNIQLDKIQKAISKLNIIAATMTAPGSTVKPLKSQVLATKVIADDLAAFAKIIDSASNRKP